MIATQQHCETVKATPVEKIIDTTGAGDCFWGGFLSKYLKYGKGIEVLSWEEIMQCAVMGNSVAGLCVQKEGEFLGAEQRGIVRHLVGISIRDNFK